MAQSTTNPQSKSSNALFLCLAAVVAVVIVLAIVGFLFLTPPAEIIEGQAEATSVRVSGKLPGRVVEFYVGEGDDVRQGDTLVHIHSSLAEAKLMQAEGMKQVATSQNQKVDAGTRKQIVQAAYDLWQQAVAAKTIAEKTYKRMDTLNKEGVISDQKRDEAQAVYKAASASESAARSQYDLAKSGAQKEDRQSAAAMVQAATGGVEQVQAVLADAYLTAPADGTIDQIYPETGELVGTGTPIMNLLKADKRWITFNVREEMLNDLRMGDKIKVMVPALGKKEIETEIYYIRNMGSYATWRATKTTGSWDSRTFEIKARPTEEVDGLRPGMSIIYNK